MLTRLLAAAALSAAVLPHTVCAQTIYPLTRAEILSGARFDFKVEFPGAPARDAVSVTVNGEDAAKVFSGMPTFVDKEDGQDYSAYWMRGVSIAKPGTYKVEAKSGDKTASVTWEVFGTPRTKSAKNVILFIGDGMTVANRTAARILSKGLVEGRYGGELAIDDMPYMAMVSTSGTDSVVTDSANSMSAYTTGHKSCVNALGVYCSRIKNTLQQPKVENITSLLKRRTGMSVGIVTNSEIEDATPAGMVAHTRRRSDYNDIVKMFYDAKVDVIMGGGSPNFLPKSTPGSKRTDEENYIEKFKADGFALATTATEMNAAAASSKKLLGLFNVSNVDGAYDLKFKKGTTNQFPDQPDVVAQTKAALDMLSKNDQGFMLMVESARIDKYSHTLDWERSVYDTIMLDNAVKVAKDFAARNNDTLIIVVPDHAHAMSIVGTYDDDLPGQTPREKLGVYEQSKFPKYKPDQNGYPETVDLPQRLAVLYGTYPDYCFNAKPYLDDPFVPAVPGATPNTYVANEKYCGPGSVRITGNLPFNAPQGVHSADDVILTATGPGSEAFHGRIDNTRVFRAMATALGLGEQ
jgi:alkaline phosphatase